MGSLIYNTSRKAWFTKKCDKYLRGSRGLKRVITEDIDYTVVNKESCVESINV